MRISDWSADVCSSDLSNAALVMGVAAAGVPQDSLMVTGAAGLLAGADAVYAKSWGPVTLYRQPERQRAYFDRHRPWRLHADRVRSEERSVGKEFGRRCRFWWWTVH